MKKSVCWIMVSLLFFASAYATIYEVPPTDNLIRYDASCGGGGGAGLSIGRESSETCWYMSALKFANISEYLFISGNVVGCTLEMTPYSLYGTNNHSVDVYNLTYETWNESDPNGLTIATVTYSNKVGWRQGNSLTTDVPINVSLNVSICQEWIETPGLNQGLWLRNIAGESGINQHFSARSRIHATDPMVLYINYTGSLFSSFNCTSCNIPQGDNNPPFSTFDTTPTFTFLTTGNEYCRISNENQNYTDMGTSRNCTSGEGSTSHTCTLTSQDALVNSTDYMYIACDVESLFGPLEIELQDEKDAIRMGIQESIIWPGVSILNNQKIYVRTKEDNQALATFDTVATSKKQRWGINHLTEDDDSIGVFYNLSPIFYFLELGNISYDDIITQVQLLINTTAS